VKWRIIVGLLIFVMGSACDPYQKGMDMIERGEYEEAADYFYQQSIKHPDDSRVFNQLGYCYSKLKLNDQAAREYAKAVKLNPDYFQARLNLGTALLMRFEITGAQRHLEKALELNPKSEAAHVNLAWTHYHILEFDKAREHINKAIELSGGKRSYADVIKAIEEREERFGDLGKKVEATGNESRDESEDKPK